MLTRIASQARNRSRQTQGGFTLVELLVVITILGVLAAIVLFNISGVSANAACNAMKTDGATIQAAQPAMQAAPAAGLMDAPEDEHAFSVAASGLPPRPGAAWARLALGAMAVSAMALAAVWLIPDPSAARPHLGRAWSRR